MYHRAVAADLKSHLAAPGVVDDLVRNGEDAGAHVAADAADRGHRNYLRDARLCQRMHVGAIVHQVRGDGVAVAVAGHEDHVAAADTAEGQRAGRFAVGRAHHFAVRYVEVGQLRQAAPAYDAEHKKFPENSIGKDAWAW
jgi:hypothetical protein